MAYDNLAYKYDNFAKMREEDEQKRREKEKQLKRLRLKERKKLNTFLIFGILAVSFAAYFMISKNVQLHETGNKIKDMKTQLAMLESETSQKMYELEQSVDLDNVEQIATTKLNMQRPEKYQIVYISVPSDDVTNVTADEVEGIGKEVGSMAENVKDNFLGIFNLGLK